MKKYPYIKIKVAKNYKLRALVKESDSSIPYEVTILSNKFQNKINYNTKCAILEKCGQFVRYLERQYKESVINI